MFRRILTATLLTGLIWHAVQFTTRHETRAFLSQCLSPDEQQTVRIANRQDATADGYTVFFKDGEGITCTADTPHVCQSRCGSDD